MITETADIRRYRGHDEDRFGIADGTLVAVIPADYDDDKYTILFTLPDLRDPQCSAYLSDVGPALAHIDVTDEDAGEAWMVPVDLDDVARAVEAAEECERTSAAALGFAGGMLVYLRRHGVTAEQLAEAYAGTEAA